MKTEKKMKMYSAAVTGLLVLSIAASAFFWNTSVNKELERNAIEMEKEGLLLEKGLLTAQLEHLKKTYDDAMTENGALKGTIEQSELAIAEKEKQISQLKKQKTADRKNLESLKKEIADMRSVKSNLEAEVLALRTENESLRSENERLSGELHKSISENIALNDKIEELTVITQGMKSLQESIAPGGIRANAFRVEVEKRNDKLTVKGRKARELSISFDLMDIPASFQGVQKIYLTITDGKGTPVKGKNNNTIKVGNSEKTTTITVQQSKEINLTRAQRIGFMYPLEEKLPAGYYQAAVYTETGWIGSVSFRVS